MNTKLKKNQTRCAQQESTNVIEKYTSILIHRYTCFKTVNMKRKGISDIIAVLLLLGITVAGAVLVAAFFQGNNVFRADASNPGTQNSGIKITGYDTRDGTTLSGIATLDNSLDSPPSLCTTTCDMLLLPATGGTEFIVLTVRNEGINKAQLQSVVINEIEHSWDSTTGGNALVIPGSYPAGGKFSIVSTITADQSSTNVLDRNGDARLVVKLSSDIDTDSDPLIGDIKIPQSMRVRLITDLIDPQETVISSGGVR
ncbi:MAG: archaellin/type IV pilin N-terminal domain-containing protein [Nitrosopumilaceae archaeon]